MPQTKSVGYLHFRTSQCRWTIFSFLKNEICLFPSFSSLNGHKLNKRTPQTYHNCRDMDWQDLSQKAGFFGCDVVDMLLDTLIKRSSLQPYTSLVFDSGCTSKTQGSPTRPSWTIFFYLSVGPAYLTNTQVKEIYPTWSCCTNLFLQYDLNQRPQCIRK